MKLVYNSLTHSSDCITLGAPAVLGPFRSCATMMLEWISKILYVAYKNVDIR